MSYASLLKKNREATMQKLANQLNKANSGGFQDDSDKYWKLDVDKAGNGYAVIRFLPEPEGEEFQFVKIWDHGFQGPSGLWYIENSLTTIGKPDPVAEYNSQLWNSGIEANKEIARKYKRRLSYVSNILVVKDPAHPENEGKVFLYKFGKKIFDKINAAMNPEFADEEKFNPYDIEFGADFKLKARNGDGGYRTYESSAFAPCGPIALASGPLEDDELDQVLGSMHSLQELVDPSKFKSYDDLKARFYKVLGLDGGKRAPTNTAEDDDVGDESPAPAFKQRNAPVMEQASQMSFGGDEDDDMAFFKNLADD